MGLDPDFEFVGHLETTLSCESIERVCSKQDEDICLKQGTGVTVVVCDSSYNIAEVETSKTLFSCARNQQQSAYHKSHIIEHVGRLVGRQQIQTVGKLVQVDDITCIDFKVFLNFRKWQSGPSSAVLLLHLKVPQQDGGGSQLSPYEQMRSQMEPFLHSLKGDDLFSLRKCVMSLPPPSESPEFPPLQVIREPEEEGFPIPLLPYDIICRILGYMDAKTLCFMSMTCKYFLVLTKEIAPGLLLGLFPHQRAAIRWMACREEREVADTLRHPNMHFFETPAADFWGNLSTGEVTNDPPREVQDFKGGFLCDDPGLGKTVTCIGLLAKSKGKLPKPDCEITWFPTHNSSQRALGYITSPPNESFHKRHHTRLKRKHVSGNHAQTQATKSYSSTIPEVSSCEEIDNTKAPISKAIDFANMSDEVNMLEEEEEEAMLWLQCELCQKWRRVPWDLVEEKYCKGNDSWCCYLHPIQAMRSCSMIGEPLDVNEEVTSLLGWVGEGEEFCSHQNIEFFRNLLSMHDHLFVERGLVRYRNAPFLLWLAARPARTLTDWFTLPALAAQPPSFGKFLKDMGFEPYRSKVSDPSSSSKGRGKYQNRRPSGHVDSAMTKDDWIVWRRPCHFSRMLPDIEALRESMQLGPCGREVKVFLSPATLIVVPSELVQHWKDQIYWHTKPGSFRVTVYDPSKHSRFGLVSPQVLAWENDVVLTTFSVLSKEWDVKNPTRCSPLSQVYWYRIVIDEGHTLGSSGITNKLQMVTSLKAEIRWCLTGTPASSASSSTLTMIKSMQPLMGFLHDDILGNTKSFQETIEKPIRFAPEVSMWRVFQTLQRTMARSRKENLRTLPKLHRKVVSLSFSQTHAASYNALIDLVRFNLLTSDWYDPDHKESLLCASQSSRASSILFNIALACNVSGSCDLQVTDKDLIETLQLLARNLGLAAPSPQEDGSWLPETHPLKRIENVLQFGGPCGRCQRVVRVLFATPCGCSTCVDCTATSRTHCPVCGQDYVMHRCNDPSRKNDNPNPKWDVPQYLIEWQPAYAQRGATGSAEGYWQPKWTQTDSSKSTYLIKRLKELNALPERHHLENTGAFLSYDVNIGQYTFKEDNPNDMPPKVIVFTQFWHHALLLERNLEKEVSSKYFALYRKQMTQFEKAVELSKFRKDRDCRIMIMDESGALGLDLSFVNYVFLMEPIANKSLEEQVISRAHRMGASRNVCVEVIAMRGSIEELLLDEGDRTKHVEERSQNIRDEYMSKLLNSIDSAPLESSIWVHGIEKERERQESFKRKQRNKLLIALRPVS